MTRKPAALALAWAGDAKTVGEFLHQQLPILGGRSGRLSASSTWLEKRHDLIGYVSVNFEPVFRDRAK
jgi:hypothetical protein